MNCGELQSEKRKVLLVSFSDFAHFVFAIIILIQMGHKDVVLNAFMNKRIDFAAIHSGCVLNVGDDGLYFGFTRVVKFSEAFTKKLQALGAKGYIPSSAKVRVQVFWHHEDKEVTPPKWHQDMILLPDIVLTMKTPKV